MQAALQRHRKLALLLWQGRTCEQSDRNDEANPASRPRTQPASYNQSVSMPPDISLQHQAEQAQLLIHRFDR